MTISLDAYPYLSKISQALGVFWPEHLPVIQKSIKERNELLLNHSEILAENVLTIADSRLHDLCSGYKRMCEWVLEEEWFFRRNGCYRAKSYDDVEKAVYAAADVMHDYMNGLLLSQVMWTNHAAVSLYFQEYLERLPAGFRYLEVGPGHGLALHGAAQHPHCSEAVGWDISQSSLHVAERTLGRLGSQSRARLELRSIFTASPEKFDAVVCSEVLEHLEAPATAVSALANLLAPQGIAFINVPCNSPAPDHISLFRTPDEVYDLLRTNGLRVIEHCEFPGTGLTLEKALKNKMSLSCVAICSRK